ncbi:MAG: hypothetical protein ACTS6A_01750, partial [Candidatus Hodgkinia cicadicola]
LRLITTREVKRRKMGNWDYEIMIKRNYSLPVEGFRFISLVNQMERLVNWICDLTIAKGYKWD